MKMQPGTRLFLHISVPPYDASERIERVCRGSREKLESSA